MTNETLLEKIRQLLAVAESTTFEAEAESFFAKAHELMLRHAIDEAMLRKDDRVKTNPVISKNVSMPSKQQLIKAKRELLTFIARQNRCQPFVTGRNGRGEVMVLVGFQQDVEFVEVLYTSVLMQMVSSCERALRENFEEAYAKVHPSVFRNNFAHAYASRINSRLLAQNRETKATLGDTETTALALYTGEVDEWVSIHFGPLKTIRDSGRERQYSGYARERGDAAARSADISGGRNQVSGSNGGLLR